MHSCDVWGEHVMEYVTDVGISKYLRHSESVSAKHYDFSVIEQSARNRAAIVNLVGAKPVLFCLATWRLDV